MRHFLSFSISRYSDRSLVIGLCTLLSVYTYTWYRYAYQAQGKSQVRTLVTGEAFVSLIHRAGCQVLSCEQRTPADRQQYKIIMTGPGDRLCHVLTQLPMRVTRFTLEQHDGQLRCTVLGVRKGRT